MEPSFRLTRHAKNRLRRWDIQEAQIAEALNRPEKKTEGRVGRFHAWTRAEARWLRVTYVAEPAGLVVITVTLRRRGPERT